MLPPSDKLSSSELAAVAGGGDPPVPDSISTVDDSAATAVGDWLDAAGTQDTAVDDTLAVTVTVSGVDEAPELESGPPTVARDEGGDTSVATYVAKDPEKATIIWSLSGSDAAALEISTGGVLTFDAVPDYEDAADSDSDNVYELVVGASDGTHQVTQDVTVTVRNVDDPEVRASFGAATYAVAEGETVTVTVRLSADPERSVVVPITAAARGGAVAGDFSGVPSSLTFDSGDTSKTFMFAATDDSVDDDDESVRLSFGVLAAGVSAGTPAQSVVSIDDDDDPWALDCSQALLCANLRFEDYTAPREGWSHLRYSGSFSPPASLSDATFDFGGVEYTIGDVYVFPGIYPEIDNAWNRAQRDQGEFRIAISHGRTWQAVPEEHYQAWELYIDGVALPFSESTRMGNRAFQWYGRAFQELFTDWTPSTINKIGIREISPTQHVPAVPSAPAYVGAAARGSDGLRISWSAPLSRLRNQSVTGYTVQWKRASDSWSDSAAVSSKRVAPKPTSTEVNGLTRGVLYTVRVIATNAQGDGPPSEDAIGRPQRESPRLVSAVVNGQTLTLRYNRQLDTGSVPANSAFFVVVGIALRTVDSVSILGTEVTLTLAEAVTSVHSVWASYVAPTNASASFLRDTDGNHVGSLGAADLRTVTNETDPASLPSLTAQFTNVPISHDGEDSFTFNIVFSEPVWIGEGLARDDLLEVTGGTVTAARWLARSTQQWEVAVQPDTRGDIVVVLPGERSCSHTGAPCAAGGRVLSSAQTVTIPGPASQQQDPNNPPIGAPAISGTARVGETLTATTTDISDADGLANATLIYQWLADGMEIGGASGRSYTVTGADVGKTISVRVSFTDDAGNHESVISAATEAVTSPALQLQTAAVDADTVTLTYNEDLDEGVTLPASAFTVTVDTITRSVSSASLDDSTVTLTLVSAVQAGETVTVDYTKPDGPNFIRDTLGRAAKSFSGITATNNTSDSTASLKGETQKPDPTPLTAELLDTPQSHDGQTVFVFELRLSEAPKPEFSYTTLRDHAFTVTGGTVIKARRLAAPGNVRWEIHIRPDSNADVTIALPPSSGCDAKGAICTEDGRMLSSRLEATIAGPGAQVDFTAPRCSCGWFGGSGVTDARAPGAVGDAASPMLALRARLGTRRSVV